jgi:3-oxoacyl-[acyl-carrier protein] reductase
VIPQAGTAAVGAINAAIEALSKAFAERGIEDGVQVNSVSPGAIVTERRLSMLEKAAASKKITLEEGVSCESCHAPLAGHVAEAAVPQAGRY